MKNFDKMSIDEKAFYFEQASGRLDLPPVAIEKDFWVTWILGRLFFVEPIVFEDSFQRRNLAFKGVWFDRTFL